MPSKTDICKLLENTYLKTSKIQGTYFKIQGTYFKIQGTYFKIQGTYFKIQGTYFKIYGLYFLQQAMYVFLRAQTTFFLCDFMGSHSALRIRLQCRVANLSP